MEICIVAATVVAAGALAFGIAEWLCRRTSAAWVKKTRKALRK